jgi:hypothetical protein
MHRWRAASRPGRRKRRVVHSATIPTRKEFPFLTQLAHGSAGTPIPMKADLKKPPKNKPISGAVTPRFIGIPTFMRLPHVPLEQAIDVDIGLIGIPWDAGTTNRPGARFGPRQVREMSALMREVHPVTRVKPYELANCADLGDVEVHPIDLMESLARIEQFHGEAHAQGIVPLSVGGDHLPRHRGRSARSQAHGADRHPRHALCGD